MKNKNYLLKVFILVVLVFLISCNISDDTNNKQDENGLFTRTITVEGKTRRYAIYIPGDLGNSSHPLIFELHGGGIYIEDMTGESGYKTPYKLWMNIADTEKFIVVYPEGLNGAYGKPTWNDCRMNSVVSSNADDVFFISTLIDELSSKYNIDQNRIYASGTSNCGMMALRLAVELSDRIAAAAVVAASMPDVTECSQLTNPISVLFMNGTDDNHLPYTGGTVSNPPNPNFGSVFSTDTSVSIWVHFDKTDTLPVSYTFPDLDNTDGGNVEKYTYANGIEGTEVVLYKINGGGH